MALNNGRVQYAGDWDAFKQTPYLESIVYKYVRAKDPDTQGSPGEGSHEVSHDKFAGPAVNITPCENSKEKQSPRILIEAEKSAAGQIEKHVWIAYIKACGNAWYWFTFVAVMLLASLAPVVANGWLK